MPDAEKKPLSRKAAAKALSALLNRLLQDLSKGWGERLGVPVSSGAVTTAELPAEGAGKALPWPVAAVALVLEGGAPGRLLVLLRLPDAAALGAMALRQPPPPEGTVPDPEAIAALFAGLAQTVAGVLPAAEGKAAGAVAEPLRVLADHAQLSDAAVAEDGWLADVKLAAGDRPVQLWFLVPAVPGGALAAAQHAAESGGAAAAKGQRGTLLVVDDQYSIRTLIRRHLEKEGFAVVECPSGEEALRHLAARKEKPAGIVLDVMMPGMDGFETCRRLREMPEGKTVPVVMCTGKGQRHDVVQALQAGANDYIVKPFTRDTLLAKLTRVLSPPKA